MPFGWEAPALAHRSRLRTCVFSDELRPAAPEYAAWLLYAPPPPPPTHSAALTRDARDCSLSLNTTAPTEASWASRPLTTRCLPSSFGAACWLNSSDVAP